MSTKFPGGFITKNYTPPTTTSASGIWTLDQQDQAQQAGIWPFGGPFNYIEDVFSTWLYTGNSDVNNIVNGIDLSTKGGLVWLKSRSLGGSPNDNALYDTTRGVGNAISSNLTVAQTSCPAGRELSAFNTNGFTLGAGYNYAVNFIDATYASWTFRKQPKFFDIVTWTGTGSARTVAHNLGTTPGCIITKNLTNAGNWGVYHRSTTATNRLLLNTTDASGANSTYWNDTDPTSTQFTVGSAVATNSTGDSYVAYLFAHNAGGFGLTGTDNVISCGSYSSDGGGNVNALNLGYEPQWLLTKKTNSTDNWVVVDNMRGLPATSASAVLRPNTSEAEFAGGTYNISATGFNPTGTAGTNNTYIYIAIRRGPMKVPTDATKVFLPQSPNSSGSFPTVVTNFPVDMGIVRTNKTTTSNNFLSSRLQGQVYMYTNTTAAEASDTSFEYDSNVGYLNLSGASSANWAFARAPSFFDEVCYTGTGTPVLLIYHNLKAVPELIITKARNSSSTNWYVGATTLGNQDDTNANNLRLNSSSALLTDAFYYNNAYWYNTAYYTGTNTALNSAANVTYVAYLFATCAGVSKVGSYTGNGTTQAIACGFSGGARFVMIKRTDAPGDWYVYDTARGMTTLTDPYLLMNTTAAEVATLGSVTTTTGGFTVNASILSAINISAASYLFLAIA
jgi:hypothetical protein